jgi:hexosaminidase
MGCDEMESGSDAEKIGYITDVSRLLQERGYTVRIWNDLITKKNLDKLPAGIQVTYWSYDGDTEDKDEKKERRSERASMPDLIQAKIPVLNYNSYYLYYIPSARDTRKDKEYMVNDIKENWNRYVWDQEKQSGIRENEYIIGSSISVWGENASKVSNKAIYKQTRLQYLAMKKAH